MLFKMYPILSMSPYYRGCTGLVMAGGKQAVALFLPKFLLASIKI